MWRETLTRSRMGWCIHWRGMRRAWRDTGGWMNQSGTTTYDASVYKNNGTLNGTSSFTQSGVTPYRVTNLAASAAGSKINLSWGASASPNVLRYRIYRHLYTGSPIFHFVTAQMAPATSYIDSVGLTSWSYI